MWCDTSLLLFSFLVIVPNVVVVVVYSSPLLLPLPPNLALLPDSDDNNKNTTALVQTLEESLTAGSNAQQCFNQRKPHEVQLKPISYADCVGAARKIADGDKAGAPMHFSRDPSAGMGVPEWWAYGNCVVRIDVLKEGDEDTFNLFVVANAASLIAQKCSVRGTPGLGGLAVIGPKKVVMIVIYGRTPPPPPRPRPSILPQIGVS
ncbi:MAG: hypothetical protein Q9202_007639 [Teloschistes flavicans]